MQFELGSSSVAPQCADKRLRRWRAQVAQLRKQLTLTLTRCPPSIREQTISGESFRWPPLVFIFCRCICRCSCNCICICELHLLARNARKASTETEVEAASTCGFNTEFAAPPTLIGSASTGGTLSECVCGWRMTRHMCVQGG